MKITNQFAKLFTSFSLSVLLCIGTIIPVSADEYVPEQKTEAREIIQESQTLTFTEYGTGKRMKLTVKYTTREESTNSSRKYITGILSLSASNDYGDWYSVGGCSVTSVSYSSNHQVATISFSFKASIGFGNATYTGSVTISL